MRTFHFEIATPERVVYKDEVEGVTLPTFDGEITILASHVPLVTIVRPGELVIRKGNEVRPYAIGGGFLEMDGTKLVVLADTTEHVAEIDEQRAEEARQRAEELKKTKAISDVEFTKMSAKLERDLNRLRVVRKYRHRGHVGIMQEGIRKE
ncbi:MAG: ATP synthase F1 subunit epsilon [Candidatus Kerfeldbacteria bacterium]